MKTSHQKLQEASGGQEPRKCASGGEMDIIELAVASIAKPVFWIAIALAAIGAWAPLAATGNYAHPGSAPKMLGFLLISLAACAAYPRVSPLRVGERLCFLRAILELGQSLSFLGRMREAVDWIRDSIGIFAGITIVLLLGALWQRFLALYDSEDAPSHRPGAAACEMIDMTVWKRRNEVRG